MIKIVTDTLAPTAATEGERASVCDALPELFYEGLFGLVGSSAVEPWTVLTLHDREPALFPTRIQPTLAHLLIAYLSWKHNLPIVTTNFDTLFELAARLLGLEAIVSLPARHSVLKHASASSAEVAIWKVHGSADAPNSICTTLQQISMFNGVLLSELRPFLTSVRACLLGYSGRDIDLYPFVSGFPFPFDGRAFWLCREFDDKHGIHARPDKFIGLQGDADEWARSVIARISDQTEPAIALRRHLRQGLAPHQVSCTQIHAIYLEHAATLVRETLCPLFDRGAAEDRLLLHAISLAAIQNFRAAARYAEDYLSAASGAADPQRLARVWILLSTCYHNLSKYERSEVAARRGYDIARAHGLREEMIHGLASIDEALRMQEQPNLPGIPTPAVSGLRYVPLITTFLVDLVRIRYLLRREQRQVELSVQDSLRHVSLEHEIRLVGTLQGIVTSLLGTRLSRILFSRRWESIRRASYRVGYAAGVANALKYRDRLRTPTATSSNRSGPGSEVVSSTQVYEFMYHNTGQALVFRDRADTLVEQGDLVAAAQLYERCIKLAYEGDNASLELKGLMGLRRCGKQVDKGRVAFLLNNIEGRGYRRIRDAVMRYVNVSADG